MKCQAFQKELPELVLNPTDPSNVATLAHLAECVPCEQDYTSLMATMSLMDVWIAPEPSPYFDQKLAVLLREEAAAPRLGFFARIKDHLLFNTGRQFRPAVAGALALFLILGGGGYAGFQGIGSGHAVPEVSATVNDLQILDKNETTLQQMDQLLQEDDHAEDAAANAPS